MSSVYIVSQLHIDQYGDDIQSYSDVFESKKDAKEFAMKEFEKIKKIYTHKDDIVYVNPSKTTFQIGNDLDLNFHHISVERKRIRTKKIKKVVDTKKEI